MEDQQAEVKTSRVNIVRKLLAWARDTRRRYVKQSRKKYPHREPAREAKVPPP